MTPSSDSPDVPCRLFLHGVCKRQDLAKSETGKSDKETKFHNRRHSSALEEWRLMWAQELCGGCTCQLDALTVPLPASALNQLDHRVEFNPWTWAIVPCHGPLLDATWKVTVGLFRAWFPLPASPHERPWEESVPYNQSTKQPTERYHEDIILPVSSIYREALGKTRTYYNPTNNQVSVNCLSIKNYDPLLTSLGNNAMKLFSFLWGVLDPHKWGLEISRSHIQQNQPRDSLSHPSEVVVSIPTCEALGETGAWHGGSCGLVWCPPKDSITFCVWVWVCMSAWISHRNHRIIDMVCIKISCNTHWKSWEKPGPGTMGRVGCAQVVPRLCPPPPPLILTGPVSSPGYVLEFGQPTNLPNNHPADSYKTSSLVTTTCRPTNGFGGSLTRWGRGNKIMTGDTVQEGNCRDLVVLRTMCACASSNHQLGEVEDSLRLQLQWPGRIEDGLFLCNFEKTPIATIWRRWRAKR